MDIIKNNTFIEFQKLTDSIFIVRDDLFPFVGGGNKARKILEISQDIEAKNCNAVVTTGGIQSNHCRVTAILAANKGWKCKIVYHGKKERFYSEKGNALLVRKTGAEVVFVDPKNISIAMDEAMKSFKAQGLKPYYVYGGGHNIFGAQAFIKAITEINEYFKTIDWYPDYIVHASGTGSTQVGIMAGLDFIGLKKTKVIGISVARRNPLGKQIIDKFYQKVTDTLSIKRQHETFFYDDYLFGGYEKTSKELDDFLNSTAVKYGLFFDSTYSGKAFWGMHDKIEKGEFAGNILFWHTGALMNIMK